jgi:branched-chain amino acid transport system permease protein
MGTIQNLGLFSLLGLGTGALVAGIAISLVVAYRASGVINLSAGAVVMVAAFIFWSLTNAHMNSALALAITLVAGVGLGAVTEFVVLRPLRNATPLAKLVATLGLLLMAQAVILLTFGPVTETEAEILPTTPVTVFGVHIPADRFILAGIVVACTAALSGIYRWSRFGLETRAAFEDEAAAMWMGLNPKRLSLINIIIASVIGAGVAVFAASIITVDTDTLPLIVVPALAAALFARFRSFAVACAAGLAIGMAENILYYLQAQPWFPTDPATGLPLPGVDALLVFLVIVVLTLFRPALPQRGDIVEIRLPAVPRADRLLMPSVIAAVAGVIALMLLPYNFRQALMTSMIGAVLALSYVVITGFLGQVSLVQLALAGVAGFVVSHVAVSLGVGFPLGGILGVMGAIVIGVIIGFASLRVRGVTLAIVSLAAAVAIEQFGFDNSTWGGGVSGSPVPEPRLFGFDIGGFSSFRGLDGNLPSPIFGFCILLVLICLCVLVAYTRRTSFGRRLLMVRSNERAAAGVGINVRNTKLAGFVLGSFIAGVAGVLYAYNYRSVSEYNFDLITSFTLLAFAYLGGISMVSGALIAGLLATQGLSQYAFQSWFGISGTWAILFAGFALLSNLIFYPEGIAGTIHAKKVLRKRRTAPAVTPSRSKLWVPARLQREAHVPGDLEP